MEHKGFVLTSDKKLPQFKRVTCGGSGTVPKELRGMYTSFAAAMEHIDQIGKVAGASKPKGRKNAKENTTSGDEPVRKGADH